MSSIITIGFHGNDSAGAALAALGSKVLDDKGGEKSWLYN
jgi:hypothetical protein